jgi:hypothetical protein
MKTEKYFTTGNYSVVDYKDKEFAKYKVTGTSRCFDDLEEAILYAIGCSFGKRNDNQLCFMVETFITMAKK